MPKKEKTTTDDYKENMNKEDTKGYFCLGKSPSYP